MYEYDKHIHFTALIFSCGIDFLFRNRSFVGDLVCWFRLFFCPHLLSRSNRNPPDTVSVCWVAVGETRRRKVSRTLLQTVAALCGRQTNNSGWLWSQSLTFYIWVSSLTGTFVEFSGLCNVAFAQHGPLSDRWPHTVDLVPGQDCV